MSSTKAEEPTDNRLTLYYHHHSYYSRKVWLTLEEKQIRFHPHIIDVIKQEQYEPWFMDLNPRGEIPVLKDGEQIIIDSKRIIDYLEDNFSPDENSRLVPLNLGSVVRATVSDLRAQIDAIEGNTLAFGLLFHPESVQASDKHYPYNLPGVAASLKSSVENMPSNLRKLAETRPENKDVLLGKAEGADRVKAIVESKERFDKELEALQALLNSMEQQLANRPPGSDEWWLCCERFTQADVSLAVLMDRLWRMGTAEHFWGRLPRLRRYWGRVQGRAAYKRTDVSFYNDLSAFWPLIAIALGVVVLTTVGLCFLVPFIRRRIK